MKISQKAYCAVRKTIDSGKTWLDIETLSYTLEMAGQKATYQGKQAGDIVAVDVKEA